VGGMQVFQMGGDAKELSASIDERDNTASQNMFLNIFLVHLSIHRCTGGAAELTGFQCPCPLFWPLRA
jgi:hypothetical protein